MASESRVKQRRGMYVNQWWGVWVGMLGFKVYTVVIRLCCQDGTRFARLLLEYEQR